MDMKGLSIFISDIRKCNTQEDEKKKVDKELAKIRSKFKDSNKLKSYERKKCVAKLLYAYMLGYEIDFGHIEAVNLLTSEKYSEKHIGYLACTLLLGEEHELITLITNSIKRDLNRRTNPSDQCLALTAIANIGGKEQAEALASDVQAHLMNPETKLVVKKKAALALLRLFRKYPELVPPESWCNRIITLLQSKDLGVTTSVMGLLLGMSEYNSEVFKPIVPKLIKTLGKLALTREYSSSYLFYGIPVPWLQVKILRFLQYFPPPDDKNDSQYIIKIIHHTISTTERIKNMERGKSASRTNSAHSVLFEAFNLAIHYDINENMLLACAQKLSKYLNEKDPNLRYLALDTMSRLAYSKIKSVKEMIRKNQSVILLALKDNDISIRRRALDLLFCMCNKTNASQIVGELLAYLPMSNYELREELVLKIAILAENYAVDFTWYVDVILTLISQSGDFVSDDIWWRVVQIVVNRDENLKKYSASTVFKSTAQVGAHENCVKVAGIILGEFGHLIKDEPGTSGVEQFNLLNSKFDLCSVDSKSILLNTFIKFYNVYDDKELKDKIVEIFKKLRNSINPEIQQRANEYFELINLSKEKIDVVLENQPPFPDRESSVLKKILEKQTRAIKKDKKLERDDEEQPKEETSLDKPIDNIEKSEEKTQDENKESSLINMGDEKPETVVENTKKDDVLDLIIGNSKQEVVHTDNNNILDMNMGSSNIVSNSNVNSVDDILNLNSNVKTESIYSNPVSSKNLLDDIFSSNLTNPSNIPTNLVISDDKVLSSDVSIKDVSIDEMIEQNKKSNITMSKAVHEDAENKYLGLLLSKSGTVIEDQNLQVSIKTEFHYQKGRIEFKYGNKSEDIISQVRIEFACPPQLTITSSQISPLIAGKSSVSQYVSFECCEAFSERVHCSIYFEIKKQNYKFQFKLPIAVSRFIESLKIADSQSFFKIWNVFQKGSPQETQKILIPKNGINLDKFKDVIVNSYRFQLAEGIEKNPKNLVFAGTFYYSDQNIPILIRLESTEEKVRLTTRSSIPSLNSKITDLIEEQIMIN